MTKVDQGASNGIIHVIDQVIYPPKRTIQQLLQYYPTLSLFSTTLKNIDFQFTGLNTVLAPTNNAFSQLERDTRGRLLQRPNCMRVSLPVSGRDLDRVCSHEPGGSVGNNLPRGKSYRLFIRKSVDLGIVTA